MKSTGRNPSSRVEDLLRFARGALEGERFESVATHFDEVEVESLGLAQAEAWWLLLTEAGFHERAELLRGFAFDRPGVDEGSASASDRPRPGEGPASAVDRPHPGEAPASAVDRPRPGEGPASAVHRVDGEAEDEFLDFESGERSEAQERRPGEVARVLARRLRGRGDVHARQWFDSRRERVGYQPVRSPLTSEVLQRHVEGKETVGQYLLFEDSTVSFAVIDLDPTAECLARMRLEGGACSPLREPSMREYCSRILETARTAGLAPVAEDTGGKGLHVWFLFAPRISARAARSMIRDLLVRAGSQPPSLRVEIFPKQDHLSGKGLGNLVKLPFGVHRATQRRSQILDESLVPLADEEAARRLLPSDPSAVAAWLDAKVRPLRSPVGQAPEAAPREKEPMPGRGDVRADLAAHLVEIAPEDAARKAFERVVAGCGVVRELVRLAYEERRLTADQARALVYTVGLLGRSNPEVDALFAQAEASRRELERVRGGRQLPMGCARLRRIVPTASTSCRCPDPPPGMYASPVLLALGDLPPVRERGRAASPVAEDFVSQIEAEGLASLESRIGDLEDLLRRLLQRMEEGNS